MWVKQISKKAQKEKSKGYFIGTATKNKQKKQVKSGTRHTLKVLLFFMTGPCFTLISWQTVPQTTRPRASRYARYIYLLDLCLGQQRPGPSSLAAMRKTEPKAPSPCCHSVMNESENEPERVLYHSWGVHAHTHTHTHKQSFGCNSAALLERTWKRSARYSSIWRIEKCSLLHKTPAIVISKGLVGPWTASRVVEKWNSKPSWAPMKGHSLTRVVNL